MALIKPDMSNLLRLSQGRWFVPLLAGIGHDGARSAELRHSLGLSASMLRRSLDHMQQQGWIQPNLGHGHPLRPEWIVTGKGMGLVEGCQSIVKEQAALHMPDHVSGRWHLPLLSELADRERRFGELEQALSPITPRALSTALKRSIALGQVNRHLEADYPPVAIYRLDDKTRHLALASRALC